MSKMQKCRMPKQAIFCFNIIALALKFDYLHAQFALLKIAQSYGTVAIAGAKNWSLRLGFGFGFASELAAKLPGNGWRRPP